MKVYDLTEQPAVRQGKSFQHMFVLCYDAEQRHWYHDVDVEEARFMDGTIYDEVSGTWLNGYLGDGEYEEGVEDCAIALQNALAVLNQWEEDREQEEDEYFDRVERETLNGTPFMGDKA